MRRVGRSNHNNNAFEWTTFLIGFTVCLILSETKGWTGGKQLSRTEDGEVRSLLFGTCNVLPSMCSDKSAGSVGPYPPKGIAPPLFHNPPPPRPRISHGILFVSPCVCLLTSLCAVLWMFFFLFTYWNLSMKRSWVNEDIFRWHQAFIFILLVYS